MVPWSVVAPGDLDGDGWDDLAVGAPRADGGGSDSRTITLVFGGILTGYVPATNGQDPWRSEARMSENRESDSIYASDAPVRCVMATVMGGLLTVGPVWGFFLMKAEIHSFLSWAQWRVVLPAGFSIMGVALSHVAAHTFRGKGIFAYKWGLGEAFKCAATGSTASCMFGWIVGLVIGILGREGWMDAAFQVTWVIGCLIAAFCSSGMATYADGRTEKPYTIIRSYGKPIDPDRYRD